MTNEAIEKEITELTASRGQLVRIENLLEKHLTQEEFFDLSDALGTANAYIALTKKRLREKKEE